MSQCTAPDLLRFFENYGWSVEYDDESTFKTGWQGRDKTFSLQVEINPTVISFEVNPFFCLGADCASRPEILAFLLDLNYQSHFVKLSISDSGVIALTSSALVEGFQFENLARTLEIVGYYCDFLYDTIIDKLEELGVCRVALIKNVTH
jgi:hypothetical protein